MDRLHFEPLPIVIAILCGGQLALGLSQASSSLPQGTPDQALIARATELIALGKCQAAQDALRTRASSDQTVPADIYYSLAVCFSKTSRWTEADQALAGLRHRRRPDTIRGQTVVLR